MIKSVLALTGPTCSGKTTVATLLCNNFGYAKTVTHTSRSPRPGEQPNKDYYFVGRDFFEQNAKDFVEFEEYSGNLYGVHKVELARLHMLGFDRCVIVIEPRGVVSVNKWCAKNEVEFAAALLKTEPAVLYERLLSRFFDDPRTSVYAQRILTLQQDLEVAKRFYLPDQSLKVIDTQGLTALDVAQAVHRSATS